MSDSKNQAVIPSNYRLITEIQDLEETLSGDYLRLQVIQSRIDLWNLSSNSFKPALVNSKNLMSYGISVWQKIGVLLMITRTS